MSVVLLVSATEEDTAHLVANGPRRDFLELAQAVDGEVIYRDGSAKPKGLRGKLFGPHVRQAWSAAKDSEPGTVIFADGEHVGLPLALFLGLRRRNNRVVMLGHYVSKKWKSRLIRLASLLHRDVTLVTHSVVQQRAAARASGGRWAVELVPYQVDTSYWSRSNVASAAATPGDVRPLLLAVGSEHRDYLTLIEAVRDQPVELVIAAGSHWARETASAGDRPANVTIFTEPLTYAELRERYAAATAVVMPLEDVPNQSGITGILEAMAMETPLIVTASKGQREAIAGPLVRESGAMGARMAGRGPALFGAEPVPAPNGLYVAPGDVQGLRRAVELICEDPALRATLAANGRATAEMVFTLESYVANLADLIREPGAPE